jgi:hypothetical protein
LFKSLKGFNDLEHERDKKEWERLRILGTWVLNPHMKKGSTLSPNKLLPLPWDRVQTKTEWLEKNKDLIPIWDKLDKAGNGKK